MPHVDVATIGFTKTTAENFFGRLARAGVRTVVDVRLHNTSQLSGFAKAEDLAYFLKRLHNIEYRHEPSLAPTDAMLSTYKKNKGSWQAYEKEFLGLMQERQIENRFQPATFDHACLLCSEATPHHCHRRLVCEYLNAKWDSQLQIKHL